MVDAGDFERRHLRLLQHAHHDRDHGRRHRRAAREAQMDHDQEQPQDREDRENRQLLDAETLHDIGREPGRRAGLQERGAEPDADAELDENSPWHARLDLLPVHDADPRHEHQRHRRDRDGR